MIYKVAGISRQAYHKRKKQMAPKVEEKKRIVEKVKKVREQHAKMGSRPLYYACEIKKEIGIGITKFENMMSELGLSLRNKRKRIITTRSVKHQYPNLIKGNVITDINKVVVGDITYYNTGDALYYIFALKDMYSKRIMGLYGSRHMYAECAIEALKQLLETREENELKEMTHHTDGGSQYLSNAYKSILERYQIQISVAQNCLENGGAEQLNGVIKNDYLYNYEIRNEKQLNEILQEVKKLLNEERPVKALGYRTPVEFEEYIKNIAKEDRPKVKLSDFNKQN